MINNKGIMFVNSCGNDGSALSTLGCIPSNNSTAICIFLCFINFYIFKF